MESEKFQIRGTSLGMIPTAIASFICFWLGFIQKKKFNCLKDCWLTFFGKIVQIGYGGWMIVGFVGLVPILVLHLLGR